MTHHVSTLSAGGGSWLTANIVQREFVRPGDRHTLVFTDTLYEDADAYRFLVEGALQIFGRKVNWLPRAEDFPDYRVPLDTPIELYAGNPAWRAFLANLRDLASVAVPELAWIVEGRDIWEVYRDERFLGNSRIDPCSKVLKRQQMDQWLCEACDPADTVIYYGIGDGEAHRYDDGAGHGIKHRMADKGWTAKAPLVGRLVEGNVHPSLYMRNAGIVPPRLYGWSGHNNCRGDCCKGGIKHHKSRLENLPVDFAYSAAMEQKISAYLGDIVSILKDRRNGGHVPLFLAELAQRQGVDLEAIIAADEASRDDSGNGCGCMVDE